MTEQSQAATADAFTGYTDTDLAWFAQHYADTDWIVHVAGPDEIHTHANPELADNDPANPVLTRESASELAAGLNEAWAQYKAANAPLSEYGPNVYQATVFHRGAPYQPQAQIDGQSALPVEAA